MSINTLDDQTSQKYLGIAETQDSCRSRTKKNPSSMRNQRVEVFIGSSITSARRSRIGLSPDTSSQCIVPPSTKAGPKLRLKKLISLISKMNKFGKKVDNFAQSVREHVRLGPKLTETMKGKWSLGKRIIQVGGLEQVFKKNFSSVREGEDLLKVSQCYLSTTAGPIAGLLFISTDKVAFCSERSIKIPSPAGDFLRSHYKVIIPITKIKRAHESVSMDKPSSKYIRLVTSDNFEFWFMGFLNMPRTVKHLQQAVSQSQC